MKKLTTQNKKWFKSIMNDLIYKIFHLNIYYKYDLKIIISYDNALQWNDIRIKLTTLYKKDSICEYCYCIGFHNDYMSYFSIQKLTRYESYEGVVLSENDLDKIILIRDNVKEFYRGVENE